MVGAKQKWSVAEATYWVGVLKELKVVERLSGWNKLFIQLFEMNEGGIHQTIDPIKNHWNS